MGEYTDGIGNSGSPAQVPYKCHAGISAPEFFQVDSALLTLLNLPNISI